MFPNLNFVFIIWKMFIFIKLHLGFLCVSTESEEICLRWYVKYCTLLWHIQQSLQNWNKFVQCTQRPSRTVYNTRQLTNSTLQACERFSARVSRQLTQRWEALSHLNQKWAIKCLSPHIKGIDVCKCVYSCTNACRIHITPWIWMFPRHSSHKNQKSWRWRLMRRILFCHRWLHK